MAQKGKRMDQRTALDPLAKFFRKYRSFNYCPGNGSTDEFYRMCRFFDWDRESEERKKVHRDFKDALVQQFNSIYGGDVGALTTWTGICSALDINPPPSNAKEAIGRLKGLHINLVDLVDRHATGRSVKKFRNLRELQDYTMKSGKFFPKESAYNGGMLKFLLREIL